MEGERGVPNNYELQVSFTNPHHAHHQAAIHEMGFVQFEENQVLSFLAPSAQSQSSSCGGSAAVAAPSSAPATNGGGGAAGAVATSAGFSHNDLVHTRSTPWNTDQVGTLDPKAVNDENCTGNASDGNNTWWRNTASEKSKVKVRRKLREPRFCFQTRSDVDVLDDGYKWRKYGQKEILGSNFPRSYFRCTHQKLYQCPAKKQVQRLDNNPNIFAVTYRGSHTCHMSSTAPSSSVPPQLMISQVESHEIITHISAAAATTSSQLSPPSSSIHCWLSPVHLSLLAGSSTGGVNPAGAESGGGSAGPSTSRFGGADYPVADMADAMFNSGSSSGNSMESLFAFADDKGEAGDNKKS